MKKTALLLLAFALLAVLAMAEEPASDGAFQRIAQSENREMYLDPETLMVRIVDTATGYTMESKIMEGKSGNKSTKNTEKSDLKVYYVVNQFIGTTNSMDNWSMSVEYNNYVVTPIENGFEIRYEIGDMTLTVDDLPKMIPVDKYKEKLLPNWTDKNDKDFREFYRIYKQTMWVRTDDGNIGKVKLNNLYKLIFETGTYTREDLIEDNAAYGYEIENENPRMEITVRYQLSGDDLLVTVPCADINFTQANPLTRIDLLPYFMTAGTNDEGYIFVPDGSGSLIYLNNGKTMALSYTDSVYGKDVLKNVSSFQQPSDAIRMPVYGIKTQNGATLAIIEEGEEIATLYADISDRSDEFNRVYSYFTLRDIEFISVVGSASGVSPRCASDVYTGDIVVRYKFLTGEDADYVGMANAYRENLISRGILSENRASDKAPFYAEILGSVRKTDFFIGIPYESRAVATTLEQAGMMVKDMTSAGINNIRVLLNGFLEGGIKHESLVNVSLESKTGGKKDLSKVASAAEETGGGAYLMLNMEKVYTTDNFSKSSQASRRLDNFVASVTLYGEPILEKTHSDTDSFYVSPRYLTRYAAKAKKALDKLDMTGIAVDDLGAVLVGDYRNGENISPIHAVDTVKEALETIGTGNELILNSPNEYAYSFAAAVYNVPESGNGYKVTDEDIPFMQMVLDGAVEYTGKPWNESAYAGLWLQMNFAIESKSAPYFRFTWENETVFMHTEDMDTMNFFMTRYGMWLGQVADIYEEFDAYWQLVKDARVEAHDIVESGLRRVTYDNGVIAYINNLSEDRSVDGYTVPAQGYLVVEGVKE